VVCHTERLRNGSRRKREYRKEGKRDLITLRYSGVRRHGTGEQKKILKD
jgi:hypothetical protein